MNRIALIALPLVLCIACSREEPAPAGEPAPAAVAPPSDAAPAQLPQTPAAAPVAVPADPSAEFDTGAFAGTFAGAGRRLDLHADGTYALEAASGTSQGSWTHEAASGSIRLDPGSKTAEDAVLRMTDRNTLADPSGATLVRQPTS